MILQALLLSYFAGASVSAAPQMAALISDISCNNSEGKQVFVLRFGAEQAKGPSAAQSFLATIEGSTPFNLASAFPKVEVQMDDTAIVVEPKVVAEATDSDLEILIDRSSCIGRFSAVANKSQTPACAVCEDATDVSSTVTCTGCSGLNH